MRAAVLHAPNDIRVEAVVGTDIAGTYMAGCTILVTIAIALAVLAFTASPSLLPSRFARLCQLHETPMLKFS